MHFKSKLQCLLVLSGDLPISVTRPLPVQPSKPVWFTSLSLLVSLSCSLSLFQKAKCVALPSIKTFKLLNSKVLMFLVSLLLLQLQSQGWLNTLRVTRSLRSHLLQRINLAQASISLQYKQDSFKCQYCKALFKRLDPSSAMANRLSLNCF